MPDIRFVEEGQALWVRVRYSPTLWQRMMGWPSKVVLRVDHREVRSDFVEAEENAFLGATILTPHIQAIEYQAETLFGFRDPLRSGVSVVAQGRRHLIVPCLNESESYELIEQIQQRLPRF